MKRSTNQLWGWLLVPYMMGALYALTWLTTEFNATFVFAAKYLTAPIVLSCYLLMIPYLRHNLPRGASHIHRILVFSLTPGLTAALLVLFSGGYVLYLNMLMGSQEPITIKGKIENIYSTGSRFRSTVMEITQSDGNTIKLNVSGQECTGLNQGDHITKTMTQGGLGLLYSKRW